MAFFKNVAQGTSIMRLLRLTTLLVSLCMPLMLHANTLRDALTYRPRDRFKWMQTSNNLKQIETNLYRRLLTREEDMETFHTFFSSNPLYYLNHLIHTRTNQSAVTLATELIDMLPPFECTTYSGIFIGRSLWQTLNINTVLRNSRFVHTYAALHTAHVNLLEVAQPAQTYKTMIRLKGKQGRLFHTFLPDQCQTNLETRTLLQNCGQRQ